ncbi:MAG: ROK family protein [Bryobacteraceae bacterium]
MTVLGIHIGSTHVCAGRVNERGEVFSIRKDRAAGDPDALASTLHFIVAAGEPPDAIGVTRRGAENPPLEDIPRLIEAALPCRIAVHTDEATRAALLAETLWGAAQGRANVLLLHLDRTVGGAAMVNRALLRDLDAARMGHFTVEAGGPLCRCGARGCLEALAATRAVEGEMMAALHRGCASRVAFKPGKGGEPGWRAILEASGADPLARAVVERAAQALAAGLAGLARRFAPEIVLLSGALACKRFLEFLPRQPGLPVAAAGVKDPSGVIAAAALAMRPAARQAVTE